MSNICANRTASTDKDEEEQLPALGSNVLLTHDVTRQKVCGS